MILELDAGNTRLKWRLREGRVTLTGGAGSSSGSWRWLSDVLAAMPVPKRVCMASVLAPAASDPFVDWCSNHWGLGVVFARSTAQCAGVRNGYADPARLGVDRWLALLAARAYCKDPLLVVDAGSAITVDLLTAEGLHLGGYIGPGVQLMGRALGQETQGVRVALTEAPVTLAPGRDTQTAVGAALVAMLVGLVEQARDELIRQCGDRSVRVIVTGGDAHLVCGCIAGAIEMPELVLDGLQLALPLG